MSSQQDNSSKTCLITGVGPATGAALVDVFLENGYRVAMIARSDETIANIAAKHDEAFAFPSNVTELGKLKALVARIRQEVGSPTILIHNAFAGAFGPLADIGPDILEASFRTNVLALYELTRLLAPDMIAQGGGALVATGSMYAYRGEAHAATFSPKAAQRVLLQSIAKEYGDKGIRTGYLSIESAIDGPWARGAFPDKPDAFFCQPRDIAQTCFDLAHHDQPDAFSESSIKAQALR